MAFSGIFLRLKSAIQLVRNGLSFAFEICSVFVKKDFLGSEILNIFVKFIRKKEVDEEVCSKNEWICVFREVSAQTMNVPSLIPTTHKCSS